MKQSLSIEHVSKIDCVYFIEFYFVALKLKDWGRDGYFLKQGELLEPTLEIAKETLKSGIPRTGARFPEFIDSIERV